MPRSVGETQLELVRAMTAEQKLWVSQSLRDSALALKAAWLRSLHPDLPEAEIQETVRRLFRDAGA